MNENSKEYKSLLKKYNDLNQRKIELMEAIRNTKNIDLILMLNCEYNNTSHKANALKDRLAVRTEESAEK